MPHDERVRVVAQRGAREVGPGRRVERGVVVDDGELLGPPGMLPHELETATAP